MPRYAMKKAILAKLETVYGTDPTPTGAANAILGVNASFEPSVGEEVSRELVNSHMGHQGVFLTGTYAKLSFEVEMAGAGAAGTVAPYGPLLKACGFAEVISAGVDVQYNPVSGTFDAVTLYFNWDGVNHIMLGSRGNVSCDLSAQKVPRFKFDFVGLLGTIADVAMPAQTLTAFKKPVPVSKANTTMSLHGQSALGFENIKIDAGVKVEPRILINKETIEIVSREATGEVTIEAAALATINWFNIAHGHTDGVMAFQHGTVAGNIVKLDAPVVQIGRPKYADNQNIINQVLPLMLKPSAGNDELKITVK